MSPKYKRLLPRPYQEKAVREVLSLYQDGARKMLLHLLPTGSGKTIQVVTHSEKVGPR
jgi:superfamily II DNA or RNA helicase